jgi:hypothetical protein
MIHGITAQARGAFAGSGGGVDPNEILYADFLAGTYRLNGEPAALSDLFAGIDEAADLDPSAGLTMRHSWNMAFGSYPNASAALLAALKAQMSDGVSVDIEYLQNGGYWGAVPFVVFSETGDSGGDADYIQLWMGDNIVTLYDNKSLFFEYNLGDNPVYPARSAATINHKTGAATWQHAVATNGSTVLGAVDYFRNTAYDITADWDYSTVKFFHQVQSGNLNYSAEGAIRAIRITRPVDFATLEQRAAQPPAFPTLAQLAPASANVALLLSFEGSQGDTFTTDRSSYANGIEFKTRFGDLPYIDEGQKAIGGSSYRQISSSEQSIVCTMDPSLNPYIGGEPFSVDFFVRRASDATGRRSVCGIYNAPVSGSTLGSWRLQVGPNDIRLEWSLDGTITNTQAFTVNCSNPVDTWIHFAVSYNGFGRYRVHRDGVFIGWGHPSIAAATIPVEKFYIGHHYVDEAGVAGTVQWRGWIDEFRLVLGDNPFNFDGNFTVPSEAYPDPA